MEPLTIAVDFDGTIVVHDFPNIGEPAPMAIETIKDWIAMGAKVILWTVRDGKYLDDAVEYCRNAGIEFYGINENPDGWTLSPKPYFHYCIDDRNVGCPMMDYDDDRIVVDWVKVRKLIGL